MSLISSAQEEDWHDNYTQIDFSELLEIAESVMGEEAKECESTCYNFSGLFNMKYKVEFQFMDSVSSSNLIKRKYIDNWVRTYLSGTQNEMFFREIQFAHEGKNYWFFVQEPTFPYYQEELAKGDSVYLYLMFAGTLIVNNEIEYIFVANDFEKK